MAEKYKVFSKGNTSLGYALTLVDWYELEPDVEHTHRYMLTGQVYGFGPNGGNHSADTWLKKAMVGTKDLVLDSEQGCFFAYSNTEDVLLLVVKKFGDTIRDVMNKLS